MNKLCERRRRCQEAWPALVEQEWSGVRHCKNCSRSVFLSPNFIDADALGRVGHCVAVASDFVLPPLFIGTIDGEDWMDQETAIAVKIRSLTSEQKDRAVAGFRLYFGQLPDFPEKLAQFTQGQPPHCPSCRIVRCRSGEGVSQSGPLSWWKMRPNPSLHPTCCGRPCQQKQAAELKR